MKTKLLNYLFYAFILTFASAFVQENNVRIKDILSSPSGFKGELVTVTGLVTQYIEATERTTAYYLIRDDYGSVIKVNTADAKPETNSKYTVSGIVYFDESLQMPFISEKNKTKIEAPVVYQPQVETTTIPEKSWFAKNLLFVILGGAGLLLIVLVIILIIRRKRPDSVKTFQQDIRISEPAYERTMPTPREDLKTMVIPASSPKTMKFIPGSLK